MKNKKKIKESADTSSTTGSNASISISSGDLKNPKVVKTIEKAKQENLDVNIMEKSNNNTSLKLEYLSEVIDSESNEVSKPFTINGKKYQMVRAITPNKEKVMGVYSFDEMNENNVNKIYSVEEFEKNIAKKAMKEIGVQEPEGPEAATLNPVEAAENPSFAGYKHFIVNKKTGKARKFKSIEELAKAKMDESEKYMGIREFKKYVDETLFGSGKKGVVSEVTPTGQESDEEMNVKAKKLMDMIEKRIPQTVISTIKTPIAQREVIAAFAEMIGVPRNGLSKLISGLKDLAKDKQQAATASEPNAQSSQPVTESKIIKVKNIKK